MAASNARSPVREAGSLSAVGVVGKLTHRRRRDRRALAVGEPIELASLTRMTDASAVEKADIRGLITLDRVDNHVQVCVAHPLYGSCFLTCQALLVPRLGTAGMQDRNHLLIDACVSFMKRVTLICIVNAIVLKTTSRKRAEP
jgi:hypothetical protein